METTGIVRRIDELGRIVIPKEIRRTMGIKEGEEMEICLGDDALVFKKYSALGNVGALSKSVASALQAQVGGTVLVTDANVVVAAAGTHRKVQGEPVNHRLNVLLQARTHKRLERKDVFSVAGESTDGIEEMYVAPILAGGDLFGSIVVLSQRGGVSQDAVKVCAGLLEGSVE